MSPSSLRIAVVITSLTLIAARCPGPDDADAGVDAGVPSVDGAVFGPTGGECITECATAEDCCSGPQCGTGLFNFRCDQGRCEQTGCRTDADCNVLPGGRCADLGGFGVCGKSCRVPEDCCPPLPPGVTIPDGQDRVTIDMEGVSVTFYRCGAYPQKFICTGSGVTPDDAGTIGICVRYCSADSECPGVPVPLPDGGLGSLRIDGGFIQIPLGDAGFQRIFQETCVLQFGPVGQCQPACQTDSDCCPDPTGVTCPRQLCQSGICVRDGCRGNAECQVFSEAGQCVPR